MQAKGRYTSGGIEKAEIPYCVHIDICIYTYIYIYTYTLNVTIHSIFMITDITGQGG